MARNGKTDRELFRRHGIWPGNGKKTNGAGEEEEWAHGTCECMMQQHGTETEMDRADNIPGVRGVLIELPFRGEDDDSDLGIAEDGDLVSLLEQPVAALGEGHLPVYLVLYPLQLHLAATHPDRFRFDLAVSLGN